MLGLVRFSQVQLGLVQIGLVQLGYINSITIFGNDRFKFGLPCFMLGPNKIATFLFNSLCIGVYLVMKRSNCLRLLETASSSYSTSGLERQFQAGTIFTVKDTLYRACSARKLGQSSPAQPNPAALQWPTWLAGPAHMFPANNGKVESITKLYIPSTLMTDWNPQCIVATVEISNHGLIHG